MRAVGLFVERALWGGGATWRSSRGLNIDMSGASAMVPLLHLLGLCGAR